MSLNYLECAIACAVRADFADDLADGVHTFATRTDISATISTIHESEYIQFNVLREKFLDELSMNDAEGASEETNNLFKFGDGSSNTWSPDLSTDAALTRVKFPSTQGPNFNLTAAEYFMAAQGNDADQVQYDVTTAQDAPVSWTVKADTDNLNITYSWNMNKVDDTAVEASILPDDEGANQTIKFNSVHTDASSTAFGYDYLATSNDAYLAPDNGGTTTQGASAQSLDITILPAEITSCIQHLHVSATGDDALDLAEGKAALASDKLGGLRSNSKSGIFNAQVTINGVSNNYLNTQSSKMAIKDIPLNVNIVLVDSFIED